MATPATVAGISTSSPAVTSGKTSVVRLSEQMTAWQAGLVPPGVTTIIPDDAPLTMMNGFTGAVAAGWNGIMVSRVGPLVVVQGLITRTTTWPIGAVIGTVGANLAPVRREKGIGIDAQSDGTILVDAAGAANALVAVKVVYIANHA